MLATPHSLKGLTVGLFGLLAFNTISVSAQDDYAPYAARCGRPRHPACPEGQQCVKGNGRWTCQSGGYEYTTTTVTVGCSSSYEPVYTPPVDPYYRSARCGRPRDSDCSEGYQCVKARGRWTCQTSESPAYTTTITESCSDYEPTSTGPDYDSTSTDTSPDYEPTSTPDYEPTYPPPDYEPTSTSPDYEPTYTPTGYEPTVTSSDYESTQSSSVYVRSTESDDSTSQSQSSSGSASQSSSSSASQSLSSSASQSSSSSASQSSSSSTTTTPPSSSFTPVVGVPGRVVERRPIQVLQNEYPDVFNMFILAMASLQARDEKLDISWYQVSGIHGYPFIPWQYPEDSVVSPGWGYCTHRSKIFNTWHRPYIVLLEQLLHEEGMKIAEEFSGADREKYLAAADDIRFPYWDWAADDTQSRVPDVVTQASISVTRPGADGAAETTDIPNPLFSYRFQEQQAPGSGLEATTVRGPNPNAILSRTFLGRQADTLELFTFADFDTFNEESENIHDGIHVNIGEDMGSVPTAAFDPIFWLHHCQIDRLMALYQATHPGAYLTPGTRVIPTTSLPAGGTDDLTTPLYPFRHPDGREWTSDDVKDVGSIFEYGYAYPEVPEGRSQSELAAFTTERINELYGPDLNAASFDGPASGVPEVRAARLEWSANVIVNPDELSGSYRILLYVGEQGSNGTVPTPRLEDLAGVAPVFSGPKTAPSGGLQLNITVPLTPALVEKQVELKPEDTVPNLVDRFYWYVEKVGESMEQVPVTELGSLQVAVVSTVAEYSEDKSQLPVKYEPQTYYAPTEGKPGGIDPSAEPPVGEKAPPEIDEELPSINNTVPAAPVRRARLH